MAVKREHEGTERDKEGGEGGTSKEEEFEGKTISGKVSVLGGIEPRGGAKNRQRGEIKMIQDEKQKTEMVGIRFHVGDRCFYLLLSFPP